MGNRLSKENYCFRIYSLNLKQVNEFKNVFTKLDFSVGQLRKRGEITKTIQKFTILIKLDVRKINQDYIEKIIDFIKRNKISRNSYGLWISLSTNYDQGGLTIPNYVKEFYFKVYSKIGGQIDFSYIFLEG